MRLEQEKGRVSNNGRVYKTIPFDYEFSGSLGSRTIVGRSSFIANWR